VRMGVTFVWVGVESKREIYLKNKDTDFSMLFTALKKRGISVLASLILFSEKHDKNTIWEDVDFVTSLKPDYLQFSPLGPIPGTKLYDDYEKQGKLVKDVPYESQHGQGKIWFHHDHFSREESEDFLRLAFDIDYMRNGASMLRVIKTTLAGYEYCSTHSDQRVRNRSPYFKKRLKMTRYFLPASTLFAQNRQSKILLEEIKKTYRSKFGRVNLKTLVPSIAVLLFSVKEYLRCRISSDVRIPKTSYRRQYKVSKQKTRSVKPFFADGAIQKIPYRLAEQPEHS
jgi:radical SAM superfamily enzyme YgiQ (UPF0313 family)